MFSPTRFRTILILSIILTAGFSSLVQGQKSSKKEKTAPKPTGQPVAWRDPGDRHEPYRDLGAARWKQRGMAGKGQRRPVWKPNVKHRYTR